METPTHSDEENKSGIETTQTLTSSDNLRGFAANLLRVFNSDFRVNLVKCNICIANIIRKQMQKPNEMRRKNILIVKGSILEASEGLRARAVFLYLMD